MPNIISWANLKYDEITRTLQMIDYAHHEVHEGNGYSVSVEFADLDTGINGDLYFKTPNSAVWDHIIAAFYTSAAAKFYLREAPTITASGTLLTSYNQDRNSSNTTSVVARSSPTITAGGSGTLIDRARGGGGIGAGRFGGSTVGRSEWILKQNTIYLFRIVSEADNNKAMIELKWYEHTNQAAISGT